MYVQKEGIRKISNHFFASKFSLNFPSIQLRNEIMGLWEVWRMENVIN